MISHGRDKISISWKYIEVYIFRVPLVICEMQKEARHKVSCHSRNCFADRRGYTLTRRPKLRFSPLDQLPLVDRGVERLSPTWGELYSTWYLAATVDKTALSYQEITEPTTDHFTNSSTHWFYWILIFLCFPRFDVALFFNIIFTSILK